MNILFEYIIVFLQIYVLTIFISGCGYLFKKTIFNIDEKYSFENNILWGFIPISFIALLANFFVPLNVYVNTSIFVILFIIILQKKYYLYSFKKFIKKSLIVSILAFILLIHSNVNNPDALLYHLPYSKILNEHKILIGLSNIHHRFAHISIIQYLSSFFNIFFFGKSGLLLPLSILGSSFLIYCLKEFKFLFKFNASRNNSLIIFLILVVSIYSFSRYSNYGNDAPVHIYYYFLIINIFKYNLDYRNDLLIKKISLIALFSFFLKPFYIFLLIIPFLLLLLNKNFKSFFRSSFFMMSFFFSIAWFLKNFLISSCFIYPVQFTCIKDLSWSNIEDIKSQSLLGEVNSKSWGDRLEKTIDIAEYNKNFEWVNTWLNNHFNVVVEKFLPIIIFLSIFSITIFLFKLIKKQNFLSQDRRVIIIILAVSLMGSVMWFLKFPIYRYGQSYLFIFLLTSFYIFLLHKIDENEILNFKKFLNILIILAFIILSAKNFKRISEKHSDSVMPHMYDDIIHENISQKFYNNEGVFTHYIKNDGSLCGYSISPCSENFDKNLRIKKIYGYNLFYSKK